MMRRLPPVTECLNCGTAVDSPYCPQCGQECVHHTTSVRHLVAELADQVFNLDSKLFRSIGLLIIKPGFLTVAYNQGKRIRYVSPLRLYLTLSVLFFLALSWQTNQIKMDWNSMPTINSSAGDTGQPAIRPGDKQKRLPKVFDSANKKSKPFSPDDMRSLNDLPDSIEEYVKLRQKPVDAGERYMVGRLINLKKMGVAGLFQKFISNIPIMMFLLLPLFAFALKILYWRSGKHYVEHLVFLLHCHAFLYLLLTIVTLLPAVPMLGWLRIASPIYIAVAMHRVYRQPLWKTALKFSVLALNYLAILAVSLGVTFVVTLLV